MNRCRGCGKKSLTVYCDDCAKDAKCAHGEKIGECSKCDIEGDLAFDVERERR